MEQVNQAIQGDPLPLPNGCANAPLGARVWRNVSLWWVWFL
jgi:hypothetical protein